MNRAHLRIAIAAIVVASGVTCSGVTQPTQVAGLSITSVVPASGPTSGGTSVTVHGHNFTQSTGVRFGSVPATVQFGSSNAVIAIAPPHAAGVVDVTVVVGGATASLTNAFTYAN